MAKRNGKKSLKMLTTTVRIPEMAHEAFQSIAEEESLSVMGGRVSRNEVYNRALAQYLAEYGVLIPGWNAE